MDDDMQNYLTLKGLCTKLGGRSRSAVYEDLKKGRLPQPIKLGGRLYWPEGDVEAHLRNLSDNVA
jgi:predicted DNA-binding transcriptional regulator AlpA